MASGRALSTAVEASRPGTIPAAELQIAETRPAKIRVGVKSFEDDYMEFEVDKACTAAELKAVLQRAWRVDPPFMQIFVGESALGADAHLELFLDREQGVVPVRVRAALDVFNVDLVAPDPDVRANALLGMGNVGLKGNRNAINLVVKALGDLDPVVRFQAARALGRIVDRGNAQAIKVLVDALDDRDQAVQRSASEALQSIAAMGDEETIRETFALMGRADWHVRDVARDVVVSLAERGDAVAIREALERVHNPDWHVRVSAAQVLAAVAPQGDEDVVAALRVCMEDTSRYVRRVAVQALATVEAA